MESLQRRGEPLSFGGVGVGKDELERVGGVATASAVALELDPFGDRSERLTAVTGIRAGDDPTAVAEL